MAGASMNSIKSRIKSVSGTMQITKAMELVATSKLRRAKERAERTRPYLSALREAIECAAPLCEMTDVFDEGEGRTLYVVLAGDRGLAGGYNANVFRLCASLPSEGALYLPIGKKATEHYRHKGFELFGEPFAEITEFNVGDALEAAERIYTAIRSGSVGRVTLIYTRFASMISQVPTSEVLYPLERSEKTEATDPLFDGDADELIDRIMPSYIAGVIYSAICESLASESGARRTAMNSANKNAEEMINSLRLRFNRARQAVITQEITEIVSGADAMK